MSAVRPSTATRTTIADRLARFPWFDRLPPDAREAVHADAYETVHGKGDVVARVGDPAHAWIGVSEGLLKIGVVDRAGHGIMFSWAPQGSWIGEGSVLKRECRRYDIVAMRSCTLVHLPAATFHALMGSSIEFSNVVATYLNERLSQFIATVEIDRLDDPTARVARMLGTLFNPVLYPQVGPALPLAQTELAELVGLSRQSINAALKQLAGEGLVTTEYGGISINDLHALRHYERRRPGARTV